jgi:hypothetical protein|tara:strand:+ start:111 stop:320 length:210 start_codon:yes stop_codon:yes gene_type:complete
MKDEELLKNFKAIREHLEILSNGMGYLLSALQEPIIEEPKHEEENEGKLSFPSPEIKKESVRRIPSYFD